MAAWYTDECLDCWTRILGLRIEPLAGCAGVLLPGVAVLIDPAIEPCERRRRIAELLSNAFDT